MMISKKH